MRGTTARRLRKLALETEKEGSSMYQFPDGSVRWDGFIRKYKDLKKEWKDKKWKLPSIHGCQRRMLWRATPYDSKRLCSPGASGVPDTLGTGRSWRKSYAKAMALPSSNTLLR